MFCHIDNTLSQSIKNCSSKSLLGQRPGKLERNWLGVLAVSIVSTAKVMLIGRKDCEVS